LQANELAQKWSLLSQLFHCFGHVLNIFDSFLLCLFTNHFNLRIAVVVVDVVFVVVVVVCLLAKSSVFQSLFVYLTLVTSVA